MFDKKKERRVGMAMVALLFACVTPFSWHQYQGKALAASVDKMTMAQVRAQTARLRKIVIPPIGTTLQDVENVYGEARVTKYTRNRKIVAPGETNVAYSYGLLPIAWQTREEIAYGATLWFHLKNGKIDERDINFLRVISGLKQVGLSSSKDPKILEQERQEAERTRRELQGTERGVLKDLLEIQMRYAPNLKTASWNLPKTSATK